MWVLFKILNFALLLVTSYFWMAFLIAPRIYLFAIDALMILCAMSGEFKLKFNSRVPALVLILVAIFGMTAILRDMTSAQVALLQYFPAILIFMLDKERQTDLLDSVTRWFAVLMGISLCVYAVTAVAPLPSFGKFWPEALRKTYAPYTNYIFFIKESYTNLMYRFNGPFLEPGHLSLINVLLLFANRLKFKERPWLWVLLLSVLVSMSLAGYLLVGIALVLLKMRNVVTAVVICMIVGTGYIGVTQLWNDGKNPVNQMVLSRLEYDKHKGFKGNNRTVVTTDKYFNQCLRDGTIWLGVENANNKGDKIMGAGYKIYLLKNGLLMLLLVGAYYCMLANPKGDKRYAMSFGIFIALCFIQRGYPAWYSWLFCYVVGIGCTRGETVYLTSPEDEEEDAESEEDEEEDVEKNVEGRSDLDNLGGVPVDGAVGGSNVGEAEVGQHPA